MSAAAYARRHGLSEQSLRWWKWRLGKPRDWDDRRARHSPAASVPPLTFVEMTAAMPSEPLEVVLASGLRVRVPADFDVPTLERLLEVVERRG